MKHADILIQCARKVFPLQVVLTEGDTKQRIAKLLYLEVHSFTLIPVINIISVPTVFDITIGFPSDEPEPTLMDAIRGKKIRSAMKVK